MCGGGSGVEDNFNKRRVVVVPTQLSMTSRHLVVVRVSRHRLQAVQHVADVVVKLLPNEDLVVNFDIGKLRGQ